MTRNLNSAKQKLDHAYDLASKLAPDDEVLSHWAKYLCVLTNGFVELALRELLTDYASKKAHNIISNFVESRLRNLMNLNEEKIFQVLQSFDPIWGDTFRSHRTEEHKAALDSIVANKNLIAHGESVGITMARMKNYYGQVLSGIKIIQKQCLNS